MIRAVFADVDGTLVRTEHRNRRAIEQAAKAGGHTIAESDWDHLAGTNDAFIFEKLREKTPNIARVFATAAHFEQACLNLKLANIGEVEILPETRKVLDLFRAKGMNNIASVSNGTRADSGASLSYVGYNLGEEGDFCFSIFRDDMARKGVAPKPDPGSYLWALGKMNKKLNRAAAETGRSFEEIKPEDCLVLEDSRSGARAGILAGMHVVQLTDESPPLASEDIRTGYYNTVQRHNVIDLCTARFINALRP